jgi:hypothetical protein
VGGWGPEPYQASVNIYCVRQLDYSGCNCNQGRQVTSTWGGGGVGHFSTKFVVMNDLHAKTGAS